MKKYLIASLLILSVTSYGANLTVFGGYNNSTKLEFKDSQETSKEDVKAGYTVGAELHKRVFKSGKNKLEVGVGTKYDSTIISKEKDEDTGEEYEFASSMPIYGSLKYSYKVSNNVNLYIQGKAGYTVTSEGKMIDELNTSLKENYVNAEYKTEGKLYTGIGLGAEMGNYILGLSYDITKFDLKLTGSDAVAYAEYADTTTKTEVKYSKVSLTVGYKFGN